MNITIATDITLHGGVVQVWSIARSTQDEQSLRDEWLIRGDSWPFTFEIKQDGTAYNLTGKTVTLEIVIPLDIDPTIIGTCSVVGAATDGIVSCTISPTDSAVAPAGQYRASLKIGTDIITSFRVFVLQDLIV